MFYRSVVIMVLVYLFSVFLRLYYPFSIHDIEEFMWNETYMINTNDGYFYAEGARDIVEGIKNTNLSPTHEILSKITAKLSQILHTNIDSVIFYMPGFIGSLIVFPIMISVYFYGGFSIYSSILCGLISSIGVSYYNRTMFGYYDTDMLILVLSLSVSTLFLRYFHTKKLCSIFLILAISLFSLKYYPSLFYVFFGFLIIIFFINRSYVYQIATISYGSFLLLYKLFGWELSLLSFIVPFVMYFDKRYVKYIYYITIACVVLFGLYYMMPNIFDSSYFNRHSDVSSLKYHYFGVINTISETSNVDFEIFTYRIAGGIFWFILGIVGILFLIKNSRGFLILTPFFILGCFSYFNGLRFSMYGVCVFAIGIGYLLDLALKNKVFNGKISQAFIIVYFAIALYPHLLHIKNYIVPSVLSKDEVEAISSTKSSIGDYAISWWDYGYAIRYYAKLNTVIDGGIHDGKDNYPVSLILTNNSEKVSYNLSRIVADMKYEDFLINNKYLPQEAISLLRKDEFYYKSSNDNDIYIVLPNRMLDILPAIMSFSSIDIITGDRYKLGVFMISKTINSNKAYFKNGNVLDMDTQILVFGNNSIKIDNKIDLRKLNKQDVVNVKDSSLNIVILKDGRVLVCDSMYLDTFYFKAAFLRKLDSRMFDEVASNDSIIIYKINKEISWN